MFSFSKPRLISIGLLLAILLISLIIPSYIEGLENQSVAEIIANVNKNAPANKNMTESMTGPAGITLGKNLTVDDITGALQNNSGVQKMLVKPL
jgi:hypothetical protein